MTLTIIDASFHRNGVAGEGFTAILFKDKAHKNKTFIASLFDAPGYCAVYEVNELKKGNIAFAMGNSWRGDVYASALRPLLKEFEESKGSNRIGPFSMIPESAIESLIKN